jgi:hypothetical protein
MKRLGGGFRVAMSGCWCDVSLAMLRPERGIFRWSPLPVRHGFHVVSASARIGQRYAAWHSGTRAPMQPMAQATRLLPDARKSPI